MPLRFLTYIFVFFVTANLFSQNRNVKVSDINQDGVPDSVYWNYEYASENEGMYCAAVNGKTGEVFEMDNKVNYCRMKNTILVPPALHKNENRPFLEEIKQRLLPEKAAMPDPSLQWIMNGSRNYRNLSNHEFFDRVIFSHPAWHHDDKIRLPGNYYLDMRGEQLNEFYEADQARPDWFNKNTEGYLVYHAQNHYNHFELFRDSLVLADSSRIYKVYTTAHGVVVRKGPAYSWVFVTDYNLTGGPDKLNFESVKKVKLLNGFLIVEQSLSPAFNSVLFVIDIEKGICARIRYNFLSEKLFEYKKGLITIRNNEVNYGFDAKLLFKSVEELHKTK